MLKVKFIFLFLVTCFISYKSFAEVDGKFEYEVKNGEATIIKCHDISENMVIPDKLGGVPVVSFGMIFSGNERLESIVLPAGIKEIESYAFSRCKKLRSIEIPEGVECIDDNAFYFCRDLSSIKIPSSVYRIGALAFFGCKNLKSAIIMGELRVIDFGTFQLCTNLTSVVIPETTHRIGSDSFANCKKLESIDIPESVYSISAGAFRDCTSLKSIKIPHKVSYIEKATFENCKTLNSITLPSFVKEVGARAFYGCSSLQEVTLSNDLKSIGEQAFSGCASLDEVKVPKGNPHADTLLNIIKQQSDRNEITVTKFSTQRRVVQVGAGIAFLLLSCFLAYFGGKWFFKKRHTPNRDKKNVYHIYLVFLNGAISVNCILFPTFSNMVVATIVTFCIITTVTLSYLVIRNRNIKWQFLYLFPSALFMILNLEESPLKLHLLWSNMFFMLFVANVLLYLSCQNRVNFSHKGFSKIMPALLLLAIGYPFMFFNVSAPAGVFLTLLSVILLFLKTRNIMIKKFFSYISVYYLAAIVLPILVIMTLSVKNYGESLNWHMEGFATVLSITPLFFLPYLHELFKKNNQYISSAVCHITIFIQLFIYLNPVILLSMSLSSRLGSGIESFYLPVMMSRYMWLPLLAFPPFALLTLIAIFSTYRRKS